MIKPNSLKPNSTIGIVSPSSWMNKDDMKTAISVFENKGYKIILGDYVYQKKDTFAGTPEQRAKDINDMFANPEIDAIICARGGYGSNRVLPLLDYNLIKNNPKIFMGYSDITNILIAISQVSKIITFHGPMLTSFKNGNVDYSFNLIEKTLNQFTNLKINSPAKLPITTLKNGFAEGNLTGGNISLIVSQIGTQNQIKTDNSILFIEDTDEYLYALERMLIHMKESGLLNKIKGLIVGEMTDIHDQKIPFGKSTDEIILDIFSDLDIPIISNFPCGHGEFQATLPISINAQLDANSQIPSITLLENPVKNE